MEKLTDPQAMSADSNYALLEGRGDGEEVMSELATQTSFLEHFVDAVRAAEFLSLKPRRVLELARAGDLPAYPLGRGARRVWRFRLSELAAALRPYSAAPTSMVYLTDETSYRSKPPKRSAGSR